MLIEDGCEFTNIREGVGAKFLFSNTLSYETRFRWISFQFRARRSKNYEAYTEYLLNNFCEAVAEIEKKDAD
ncbi:MAG: hypothetical protein Q8P86_02725, partial [bacterium]|nr:hypothetical protein [bacterium]